MQLVYLVNTYYVSQLSNNTPRADEQSKIKSLPSARKPIRRIREKSPPKANTGVCALARKTSFYINQAPRDFPHPNAYYTSHCTHTRVRILRNRAFFVTLTSLSLSFSGRVNAAQTESRARRFFSFPPIFVHSAKIQSSVAAVRARAQRGEITSEAAARII